MSLCLKELIYATSPHTALSIKNNAEEETDFCHLSFDGMVSCVIAQMISGLVAMYHKVFVSE